MADDTKGYVLDNQVGYLLRRATQRHIGIFGQALPELTPTQFAALAKICELGAVSQNALGRATAMDAATIKGVVDRLRDKGLIASTQDANDKRRLLLAASDEGRALYESLTATALRISAETLEPLSEDERIAFVEMLARLG
ncbi:MarR family transcriptional regulator [Pseudooceanicola sp. 216_PA32_1]|uniref:MarR family transcriptional regulator n=1 Tax=Pseudooceanicola pacificus TaxID=2676438 RepID=A0A844W7X9_9RHOB|nr:MarR family transcriptional regulator [Pseudooceanicola pacificus]MWB78971.1 MarR family transcriptional regulator [Pseudooceanicola pacificus]